MYRCASLGTVVDLMNALKRSLKASAERAPKKKPRGRKAA
jgi:non-homologous end joining protein Ku